MRISKIVTYNDWALLHTSGGDRFFYLIKDIKNNVEKGKISDKNSSGLQPSTNCRINYGRQALTINTIQKLSLPSKCYYYLINYLFFKNNGLKPNILKNIAGSVIGIECKKTAKNYVYKHLKQKMTSKLL